MNSPSVQIDFYIDKKDNICDFNGNVISGQISLSRGQTVIFHKYRYLTRNVFIGAINIKHPGKKHLFGKTNCVLIPESVQEADFVNINSNSETDYELIVCHYI